MSLRWTTFSLLLAVAAATTPRFAAAQPVAPPSSAATPGSAQLAEAHYMEGVRLLLAERFAEAEAELEATWALNQRVDVAFTLGNAEYRQGKYREAAEHFSFALRVWPAGEAMAEQRPVAEQRLAESRTHVGALTVDVNVAQAEVLVDGASVGKAPLPGEVFVEPGAHRVEAKLKGSASAEMPVAIEKGQAKTVKLTLATRGKEADARRVKPGPGAELGLSPRAGGAEDPRGEGGPNKGVIVTGIASSAAAITGGVVFAIMSSVKAADADEQRAALVEREGPDACRTSLLAAGCGEFRSTLEANRTFGNVALWSFVAGGVLGAGTAIYALTAPRSKRTSSVQLTPAASAHCGGILINGRW